MSSPAQAPGGEEPLESLIDRLQPRLKRVLGRYRIPFEDAEDVLQQSFLDFVYKRPTIYNPDAWLLATVRYRSILYWRRRRHQLHEGMDVSALEGLAKPQPPAQARTALRRDLERALGELPARSRSLLKLRYGWGLKPAEVADELGYQPSSVRKLTSRCLDRLQRRLQELGFTAEDSG